MRRFLGSLALIFAVLALHGGLGASCQDAAMTTMASGSMPTGAMSGMPMAGHDDSAMALHHVPAAPTPPQDDHTMTSCRFILPRVDFVPPLALLFLGLTLAAVLLVSRPGRLRPSGREPPYLRYLDPIRGLGVIRT